MGQIPQQKMSVFVTHPCSYAPLTNMAYFCSITYQLLTPSFPASSTKRSFVTVGEYDFNISHVL